MKKYRALIMIVVVILVTFTMYVVQQVNATVRGYEIMFEKLTGDEQYVDNLVLEGHVQSTSLYTPVTIKGNQLEVKRYSQYNNNLPTFYEKMMAEHKSFMRGKEFDANRFYEDETRIIYVGEPKGFNTFYYEITVQNKMNSDTKSFSIQLKPNKKIRWTTLDYVGAVGSELKLFVKYLDANDHGALHLITVDLKTEKIIGNEIVESLKPSAGKRMHLGFVNEYFNIAPEKYLVYKLTEYVGNGEETTDISHHYKAVHVETNAITEIEMPEELLTDEHRMVVDGHLLLVLSIRDGELVLNRYQLGQHQWLAPVTLDESDNVTSQALLEMRVVNERMYISAPTKRGQLFVVYDVASGEMLYSGYIKPKTGKENLMFSLDYIYG